MRLKLSARRRVKGVLLAVATACVAAGMVSASAGGAIVGPKCGLGSPVIINQEGDRGYLTPIVGRKGISCSGAKAVAKAVMKRFGDSRVFCGAPDRYARWTIRHVGNPNALHARFRKGSRRFEVKSQGSC